MNSSGWLKLSLRKFIALCCIGCPQQSSRAIFFGLVFFRSAPFNAATIFTVLAALRSMSEPVRMLPEALSAVIQVHVYGSIAYVSQTAWIQSGTVHDNILFGRSMDENKYHEAVKVSTLDKDIDSFDYGDLTEIGQRGLNMSGGQKQRIQLARAVYSDADIYVLDDPFSSVDAHTAGTLFNDCVMTALKNKTVILVTHQVEFLSEVDQILVMQGGQITQSGSYNELLMSGMDFEQLVNAHRDAVAGLDPLTDKVEHEPYAGRGNELEETDKPYIVREDSQKEVTSKPGIQLTQEEEKETESAVWKIFLGYVVISEGPLFLCCNIIAQAGFVASAASYWLAVAIKSPKISNIMVIGIYTSVSLLSTLFEYLRSIFAALLGLKESKAFFSGFTNSIFNAPMLFFDSTPVGRILTRASSDLSVLDYDIPFSYAFVMAAGMELLATIGIMASVTWQVLLVGIIATVGSKFVQEHYQPSAQELMRINGTTKAPVMNYATETSLGVATIRAFGEVDRFFKNYLTLVGADAKVFLFSNGAMEWLVLRTEALQNITLFIAAFLLVSIPKGHVSIGLVGLSLSYALALTSLKDLRSKLSIIPQEPTLFKGSVRTNLDPLGLYSDDKIWKALEKCQLKDTISILPNLLDSSVSDEGENWSMGQRQLFCLGRVLLRRNRILVLDEATASIDSATDAILQRIIRGEFSNCTVITVAHRVPTVLDSDMVMVLSFGELVEYDQPSRLMQTNSSFAKLVAEYWSSSRRSSLQKLDTYH
ncbi:ABC transporter C family member 8 [Capsicum annuum]|nr:ABC transporter C family member 8 [Capsicum annuum]